MKKILFLLLLPVSFSCFAQKYATEKAFVKFFSDASVEDITASNTKAVSMLDLATGEVAFSIPIRDFVFAKSLMRDHFNEKYMESDKFPKSTFQGTITGFQPSSAGVQNVKAQGKLTIHGETKEVDVPGTLEISGGKIMLKSKFVVKLEEYKVKRPQLLWKNIAEQVEVTIDFTLTPHD